MKAVKARKDAIVGPWRNGVERSLKTLKGCTVYEGHAQFAGPKEVQVGNDVLKADRIFIDVGGRALVPPIPGLDRVPYLTNSSMMDVDFLPRHSARAYPSASPPEADMVPTSRHFSVPILL
jgi:pyruvate/2-oxoglutarate dehydrogenase complex dihydrolipoamide dehydrogenase (E3) component